MLYSRYDYAATLARGKRVLEIGCGPGLGIGLIGRQTAFYVAGDYDHQLLGRAKLTHGSRFPLLRLDAQCLPFRDATFDLVLFFEGSYYVPDMETAFDEMTRVLASGGKVLFVNANPERPDFIRSPQSVHYHSAEEFRAALGSRGFAVTVEGAFPLDAAGSRGLLFLYARRLASRFGLVPRTLAGRTVLKRLLMGRLVKIPDQLTPGFGRSARRSEIRTGQKADGWKVLYVTARR